MQRIVANDSVAGKCFQEFVGIDWSGARENYGGIAVAICEIGNAPPTLVRSRGKRWTRREIAEWLVDKLNGSRPVLVGLDFAFGLPYEEDCGYLGGTTDIDSIFRLWSLIEEKSASALDFGCSPFVDHPDHSHLFWQESRAPAMWVNRKRRTELVCAEVTRTRPDTVYKLIGPKQVGKASITGIRVLKHVRSRTTNVAVWPFEAVHKSALVEIYPTLFRMRAMNGIGKVRTWPALNQALRRFGSNPAKLRLRRPPTDHETDALLSAAGLRAFASDPEVWAPDEIQSPRVQREGWIFGVKFSCSLSPDGGNLVAATPQRGGIFR
jgi:hypothetical protein